MQQNTGKIKLILLSAILIVIALVGVIIFQLVSIHKINNTLSHQQETIQQLKDRIDYYENNQD